MPINSMTGFARVEGSLGETHWVWELKSVNGRGLEPRFRLPPGYDYLEQDLRKLLAEKFSRGSINVFLSVRGAIASGSFSVNRQALEGALKLIEELRIRTDCEKPRPEGILSLRGIVEQDAILDDEYVRAEIGEALKNSFCDVVTALSDARRREGIALEELISSQLSQIEGLTSAARESAEAAPEAIKSRIAGQLTDLLAGAVPDDRVAQEAAILAVKADVREELDRLDAHAAAGRQLISAEGAVGRKLDFLTQEFNREANTLCSKAQEMGLKRIGLDLKTAIDQMREQVQNLE